MDLGGPKIRTGSVLAPFDKKRVFRGNRIVLSRCDAIGNDSISDESIPSPVEHFQTYCTVPEILDLLTIGTTVYIDDGKIRTRAIDTQYPLSAGQTGILLEVTHASPKGVKLRPESCRSVL